MFCNLWIKWIIFWQLTAASGEKLYYNRTQLLLYARLSRQLRNDIQHVYDAVKQRLDGIDTSKMELYKSNMNSVELDMRQTVRKSWNDLQNLPDSVLKTLAYVYKAVVPTNYTDASKPVFGDVRLQHGVSGIPATGLILIMKAGVYLMELKIQTADRRQVYTKTRVFDAEGKTKYYFNLYTDHEVTPYFELLILEPGDTIQTEPPTSRVGDVVPTDIMTGIATQISLIYLGRHDSSDVMVNLGNQASSSVISSFETIAGFFFG